MKIPLFHIVYGFMKTLGCLYYGGAVLYLWLQLCLLCHYKLLLLGVYNTAVKICSGWKLDT